MSIDYRGEKFSGYNKPKRTSDHPKKSHAVLAKEGSKIKLIRFGEKGASTAGKPKAGESARMKAKRKSFKARHGKNIAKGKMSAAYWAEGRNLMEMRKAKPQKGRMKKGKAQKTTKKEMKDKIKKFQDKLKGLKKDRTTPKYMKEMNKVASLKKR